MLTCSRAFYQYEFMWQNMSGVAVYWEKCVNWGEAALIAWRASRVVLVIASCKGRACAGLLQSGLFDCLWLQGRRGLSCGNLQRLCNIPWGRDSSTGG